jgi:hypothetical protein
MLCEERKRKEEEREEEKGEVDIGQTGSSLVV